MGLAKGALRERYNGGGARKATQAVLEQTEPPCHQPRILEFGRDTPRSNAPFLQCS